jgi:hypothetical protein
MCVTCFQPIRVQYVNSSAITQFHLEKKKVIPRWYEAIFDACAIWCRMPYTTLKLNCQMIYFTSVWWMTGDTSLLNIRLPFSLLPFSSIRR